MTNTISNADHTDFNISISHQHESFDESQLLNSSFFSSDSTNVMDHSRSFRNSLILREMSDFNINESLEQSLIESLRDNNNTAISDNFINNDLNVQQLQLPSNSTSVTTGTFNMKRNEIQTVNITTSPSLSALADLLNEKSKNAERKMKSSLEIHSSILEEDEEEEHEGNVQNINNGANQVFSTNLIDLNDEQTSNGNIFVTNMSFINRNQLPIEQPDFLTTPVVEQKPNYGSNDDVNRNLIETNIQANQESRNIPEITDQRTPYNNSDVHEQEGNEPLEEILEDDSRTLIGEPDIMPQSNTNSNWSRMLAHHANSNFRRNDINLRNDTLLDAGKVVVSSVETNKNLFSRPIKKNPINKPKPINQIKNDNKPEKQKKRRSLFSFFQKKPSKSKNNSGTMIRSVSLQDGSGIWGKKRASPRRIVTTTSSTLESEINNSKSLSQTFQKNRTRSTNKIISTKMTINDNKKNNNSDAESKDSSQEKLQEPVSIQKQRKQKEESTIKEEQRNITSLDSKKVLNGQNSEAKSLLFEDMTNSNELISELRLPKHLSPSVSDRGSKRDSGEVYFPKSLDEEEIDYITQIERNRSIRSSTKRRSIDTLSIKAQNEGMTIFEPSDVVLDTPDLTKSPTSSILKNIGTFDNNEITHDLSLGSIEEKLNELSLAFDEEPSGMVDSKGEDTFFKTSNHGNRTPKNRGGDSDSLDDYEEDNDLMNDIREFANIIDFGDGLNLDLDLNFNSDDVNVPKDQPKTFNPRSSKREILSETSNMSNGNDASDNGVTFQNSGLGLQFDNDNIDINNTNFANANIKTQYGASLAEPLEVEETEDFNNETFNTIDFKNKTEQQMDQNHVSITSPHMEEYIAQNYSTMERPISMSFNGLLKNTMNSSVSSLNTNIQNSSQKVKFSSKIILYETYDEFEYDRHPDISTCNQLTPQLAQMIKAELNELKSEMEVHEDSRCYTQFF